MKHWSKLKFLGVQIYYEGLFHILANHCSFAQYVRNGVPLVVPDDLLITSAVADNAARQLRIVAESDNLPEWCKWEGMIDYVCPLYVTGEMHKEALDNYYRMDAEIRALREENEKLRELLGEGKEIKSR